MKVALVYDRLNKFGGAERLLLSLHRLFPEAPIFTLVHEPSQTSWARGIQVIPTFLNHFKFLRRHHEWLAPIAPLAFETLDFSGFDLVISITSSDAKSILTKPNQIHLCYCLTPTRYFWSGEQDYAQDLKLRLIPSFFKKYLAELDLITSSRPDHYLSISHEVQKRVKKYYNRDSQVIYPPIEDKFFTKTLISSDDRDYFLVVSRLVPYKKVDLAIQVFNKLGLPLVIVGTGSEMSRLKNMAKSNIKFVGAVGDEELIDYYRHAKAVIFPQSEDLGLVPIEAQASGTPVIAYGQAGALETIASNQTGLFFKYQTEKSLALALSKFPRLTFAPTKCRLNAEKFRYQTFADQFLNYLKRLQH